MTRSPGPGSEMTSTRRTRHDPAPAFAGGSALRQHPPPHAPASRSLCPGVAHRRGATFHAAICASRPIALRKRRWRGSRRAAGSRTLFAHAQRRAPDFLLVQYLRLRTVGLSASGPPDDRPPGSPASHDPPPQAAPSRVVRLRARPEHGRRTRPDPAAVRPRLPSTAPGLTQFAHRHCRGSRTRLFAGRLYRMAIRQGALYKPPMCI